MPLVIGGNPARVPFAPTLISPVNGAYLDLAVTPTFQWKYNPGQVGNTQSAWQFLRLVNGGVTAHFWNAATFSWQTSPVWNSGSIQSYTFPNGAWVDGNVYQWAMATRDGNGTGPQSGFFTINAQSAPVVTVLTPSGTITSADPIVSWSVSTPSGATQTTYRVIIYSQDQYSGSAFDQWDYAGDTWDNPSDSWDASGGGAFTPGQAPSVYDSGTIGSTTQRTLDLSTIPLFLVNGTTYRAYVQVQETGGQYSAWAFSTFTVSFFAPNPPTITAIFTTDPATGCPVVNLEIQGHDNLLSYVDSLASTAYGIGSWAEYLDCAVTPTTGAVQIKSLGAGQMVARTNYGTAAYQALPNTEYTASGEFKAAANARTCNVGIGFFDSSGLLIGSIAYGTGITDTTTGYTAGHVTATSPMQTAYVAIFSRVLATGAANEIHDFTNGCITVGTGTTWSAGGFVGLQTVVVLRTGTDGSSQYERNCSPTNPLPMPSPSQYVTHEDFDIVSGVTYVYAAQILVTTGPNESVISTAANSNAVGVLTHEWWELDPLNPSSAINAQCIAWNPQVTEQSTAHLVMGQTTPNVVANVMGGLDGTATFELFDDDTYTAFQNLLQSQRTIFVSSPWGPNDSGYVRFGPQTGAMSSGSGNTVKSAQLMPSVLGSGHRTVQVTWVAQPRPQV